MAIETSKEWPTFFSFVKICLSLLKRRLVSLNGVFNMLIASILYYIIVKKKCLFNLMWMVYKRLEKLERAHLIRK